jgi:hypothetical protein
MFAPENLIQSTARSAATAPPPLALEFMMISILMMTMLVPGEAQC